jgi:prephenate dehydrogenase
MRVAIIGVGLIGGSFGLALKSCGFAGSIAGVDQKGVLEAALRRGAIDEACAEIEPAVVGADLVLLATPILTTLDLLERVRRAAGPAAMVTDTGSTKFQICGHAATLFADGPWFVGGHPLAGRERHGIEAAEAALFAGASWALTPQRVTHLQTEPGRHLMECLKAIGASPVVMDAEAHDEIVSWTSHLPQLASTALAAAIEENLADPEDLRLSGSGLRDSTRLADSSYRVWRDICLTNGDNLDVALAALVQKLEHLRENLRTRDLEEEFRRARGLRERLRGPE